MNITSKKMLLLGMIGVLSVSAATGCSKKSNESGVTEDGKILLKMETPDSAGNPQGYENAMKNYADFEAEYSNVKIEPVNYTFNVRDYAARAQSNQLPTFYYVPLTEASNCIEMGYAADITDELKERGYYDNIAEFMLENISRDGRVYCFPQDCYEVGIVMNVDLLKAAGYITEDGTPTQPETWEDLAIMAQKIKQTTGKAGFVLSTMGNNGGWRFTPIAWSYGVDFMEKIDGKWTATFNTQECYDALQFVSDLKWKYDVLPDNIMLDYSNTAKLFAAGDAGMTFSEPNTVRSYLKSGMSKDNVAMVKIPKGPKRHVTLLGGDYHIFNAKHTKEQIAAGFDYKTFIGAGRELTEERKERIEDSYKLKLEQDEIIGMISISPWKDSDPVRQYTLELDKKYMNVNENHLKLYNDKSGLEFQEEEPVEAQALYGLFDAVIQEILTNKDANIPELVEKASMDFQKNYLDYAE